MKRLAASVFSGNPPHHPFFLFDAEFGFIIDSMTSRFASTSTAGRRSRGHGEESVRLQQEADVRRRHHGIVLSPRHVRVAERIPEDHVAVLNGPVAFGPIEQPAAAVALVGVIPRSVVLSVIPWRDPDVLIDEPGPLPPPRGLLRARQILSRSEMAEIIRTPACRTSCTRGSCCRRGPSPRRWSCRRRSPYGRSSPASGYRASGGCSASVRGVRRG
ncbi:hypothetical protein BH11PLA2_BH11PLA2_40860 [soil metagenome]